MTRFTHLAVLLACSQVAFYLAGAITAWEIWWPMEMGGLHPSERMGVIFIWLYFVIPPVFYWFQQQK